jgi:hypothetical protein
MPIPGDYPGDYWLLRELERIAESRKHAAWVRRCARHPDDPACARYLKDQPFLAILLRQFGPEAARTADTAGMMALAAGYLACLRARKRRLFCTRDSR